ncbi:MAG: cytochrome P450 [Novosphingobium sp.]|nr:cytochrome P450 [Novosphingobium sp.]
MKTEAYSPAAYDPFSPEVMANPLPFYERLRAKPGIHFIEKYDAWVFSRFQDIIDVLTIGGNAFIASESTLPSQQMLLAHHTGSARELPLDPLPGFALLGSPHYEALRQAHVKPLQPRAVKRLEGFVRSLANRLLDQLLPARRFDLTQDYGGMVSASVICHLFGIAPSRAREVLEMVNALSRTDQSGGGIDVPAMMARHAAVISECVRRRRMSGADGAFPLIDGLIHLDHFGRPLSDEEIANQLVCVFVGGTETVPKIAAHGLMELANVPDQLAEVRADLASNVPVAVEEMIRFCAPAQWFARTAHKDVRVAGADIRKGQRIILLFGSAKWDEAEFDQPQQFRWNRPIRRVLSFGTGQHYCFGIHLARLELRILVEAFLSRVSRYAFEIDKAIRYPSSFQWGWNSLPVVIHD